MSKTLALHISIDSGGSREFYFALDNSGSPEFWQGTDGPGSKKSDLPLSPGDETMVVRDDGSVYLGSNEANDPMAVSGSTDDDYAAWTDITDSLDTAKPIKALKTI